MMNVIDAIKMRKSIRSFLDKPVEDAKLNTVLEAGRLAPSAANRQEWRFLVIREPETRNRIAMAAGRQKFVGEAPIIIVACAETDNKMMRCGQLSYPIDVAIALDHMTLAAVELGLGTCWIGNFDDQLVKKILGIPDEIHVVQLLPLGYPEDPSVIEKDRLAVEKIVRYDRW
jgi:nitroreductase